MITYLLNYLLAWGLSLAVLLAVYKLWLENQAMHRLKRAYLLGTLLLPLILPLITVEVSPGTLPVALPAAPVRTPPAKATPPRRTDAVLVAWLETGKAPVVGMPKIDDAPIIDGLGWLYEIGTVLMLFRFGRNLYLLRRQVRRNPTEPFGGATLVKLPGEGLPYTFLHYLFVSEAAYRRGDVEPELLTHELAHIRQRHSVDVLLAEMVLCVGWFNPLLIGLKRAAQLNHEFLADEAVNTTYLNVPCYQRLLLSKLSVSTPLALTSTLTFQTTKQRLLMMTKQSSPLRRWLTAAGTILLFAALTIVLTARTVARQVPAATPPTARPAEAAPPFGRKLTPDEMGRWFMNEKVDVHGGKRGQHDEVLFRELTPDQKRRVEHVVTEHRKQPTEAQWKDWQNTKKYGLWVDEKRRRDNPLDTKYKRTDIVYFWSSYVYKNARQPEGYTYRLDLYTNAGYQELLKGDLTHPSLHLWEGTPLEKKTTR